jgi:hypothetical protein
MAQMIDVSRFPIVFASLDARTQAGASSWGEAMDALLARREPFVLISSGTHHGEDPKDAMERLAWYKARDADLARWCRSMILIQPDNAERAKLQAQTKGLKQTFSFRFDLVGGDEEAMRLAKELLREASA